MTLSDLITKIEAAETGSRELDAAVDFCTGGNMTRCNYDEGSYCGDCGKGDGCGKWLGLVDERTSYPFDWREDDRLPHYTTSLDAAVALCERLLPGWGWQLSSAGAILQKGSDWRGNATSDHKSPALALCLATLKAYQQENG